MALGIRLTPNTGQRILLAHSNVGPAMREWHDRRRRAAGRQGFAVTVFDLTAYHPYTIFPYLDRLWRRRDPALMRLYEALGEALEAADVFIHYNGALIHPEFLSQFRQLTIYHSADDPDASNVLSRPVAAHYDICAISNPACIPMYRDWGCRHVFFWPLGSFSYDDEQMSSVPTDPVDRPIPLVFVGSRRGVSNVRFIGRMFGLYQKTRFMNRIERAFPELMAYGAGWKRGRLSDEGIAELYRTSRVGFNVHNSLGPINGRLYDLAAFGVCQICDNRPRLSLVFEEGREIVGFDRVEECVEMIRYYLAAPHEAQRIANAGRARYLRDYTADAIWRAFVEQVNQVSAAHA